MPGVPLAVLVQGEDEAMIGTCYKCRHADGTEPGWLICLKRGRVNSTYARQYHDCHEPRTCVADDYDDYRGEKENVETAV